jgi:hypothetical protein
VLPRQMSHTSRTQAPNFILKLSVINNSLTDISTVNKNEVFEKDI